MRDEEKKLSDSLIGKTFTLSKKDLEKFLEGRGYEYVMTKEEIMEELISNVKECVEELHDGIGIEMRINISPESLSVMRKIITYEHPDESLGIKIEEWE